MLKATSVALENKNSKDIERKNERKKRRRRRKERTQKTIERQKEREKSQTEGRLRSLTSCGAAASGRCRESEPPAGSLVLKHTQQSLTTCATRHKM